MESYDKRLTLSEFFFVNEESISIINCRRRVASIGCWLKAKLRSPQGLRDKHPDTHTKHIRRFRVNIYLKTRITFGRFVFSIGARHGGKKKDLHARSVFQEDIVSRDEKIFSAARRRGTRINIYNTFFFSLYLQSVAAFNDVS